MSVCWHWPYSRPTFSTTSCGSNNGLYAQNPHSFLAIDKLPKYPKLELVFYCTTDAHPASPCSSARPRRQRKWGFHARSAPLPCTRSLGHPHLRMQHVMPLIPSASVTPRSAPPSRVYKPCAYGSVLRRNVPVPPLRPPSTAPCITKRRHDLLSDDGGNISNISTLNVFTFRLSLVSLKPIPFQGAVISQ